MTVFLPGYQWVTNPRNGGGTYATDGPSSILLHMTVSKTISASYISTHQYPPHLWANPYNGDRFQTVSLDRSAFALYQPSWDVQSWTNKKGYTLQTELVGVPEVSVATYTDAQCKWIGEQVVAPQAAWLASIGKPVNLTQVRYHPNTSSSASEFWSGRMSEDEWDAFNGLCAHIDVPYNDHWDCSAERLDRIAEYARAALDGVLSPSEEEDLTPDQDKRLTNVEAMLKALDPVIRTSYNYGVWNNTEIKTVGKGVTTVDPIIRDTFNLATWNNTILNQMAGDEQPTTDRAKVLSEASADELLAALRAKLGGTLAVAADGDA